MDSTTNFPPPYSGRTPTPTYNNPYSESVLMHTEIPLTPPPIPESPPPVHPPVHPPPKHNNNPYTQENGLGLGLGGPALMPPMQQPIPQAHPHPQAYTHPYPAALEGGEGPYAASYPPPSQPPPLQPNGQNTHPPPPPSPPPHLNGFLPQFPPRSPSPTPSEIEESKQPFFSKNWREWIKKPKSWLYILLALLSLAIAITFGVLHDTLARDLKPAGDYLTGPAKAWGWILPIAIMVILSFPPLFGHEFVALLVGDFYGLGVGFLIVAGGTVLGEVVNFFVFRYWCSVRGRKLEDKSFFYACVSGAIRGGGFKIAALARLSAIPPHFTTTIFATCGMGFWTFLAAAIVSLPKQLGTVAAGALLASSSSSSTDTKPNKLPSYILLGLTIVATIVAQKYIGKKIDEQRLVVVRERRRVHAEKAAAAASAGSGSSLGATIGGDGEGEGEGPETAGLIERGEGHGVNAMKPGQQGYQQQRKMKKFWRRMSNGEFSHVW